MKVYIVERIINVERDIYQFDSVHSNIESARAYVNSIDDDPQFYFINPCFVKDLTKPAN